MGESGNDFETSTHIDTQGGAYVEGSVTLSGGGSFIGRDAYYGYTAEQVRALIATIRRADQPKTWDGRIPFKGLNPFREADAHFFYGREALVETLLERMRRVRFLCVAGPSGSGKSSLLRAGLIYALKQGRLGGSEGWLFADLTPRRDPIAQLAQAMVRVALNPAAADYLAERGMTDPLALHRQAEALLGTDPRQRLVLLVDQFEELFTQTRQEPVRKSSWASLSRPQLTPRAALSFFWACARTLSPSARRTPTCASR
jgi:hypothetical protein